MIDKIKLIPNWVAIPYHNGFYHDNIFYTSKDVEYMIKKTRDRKNTELMANANNMRVDEYWYTFWLKPQLIEDVKFSKLNYQQALEEGLIDFLCIIDKHPMYETFVFLEGPHLITGQVT